MNGKNMARACALVACVVLAIASLAACAGGAGKAVDIGWATFEMPDGYVQVDDLPDHATISTSADTDPRNFKLDERTIQIAPWSRDGAWSSAQGGMAKQASKYPDKYGDVEEVWVGDNLWYVSAYTYKDKDDSVTGCADLTGSRCVIFTAYYMDLDDPDLQTVLESLEIDDSKLP